jgi:hypothetical protein
MFQILSEKIPSFSDKKRPKIGHLNRRLDRTIPELQRLQFLLIDEAPPNTPPAAAMVVVVVALLVLLVLLLLLLSSCSRL